MLSSRESLSYRKAVTSRDFLLLFDCFMQSSFPGSRTATLVFHNKYITVSPCCHVCGGDMPRRLGLRPRRFRFHQAQKDAAQCVLRLLLEYRFNNKRPVAEAIGRFLFQIMFRFFAGFCPLFLHGLPPYG